MRTILSTTVLVMTFAFHANAKIDVLTRVTTAFSADQDAVDLGRVLRENGVQGFTVQETGFKSYIVKGQITMAAKCMDKNLNYAVKMTEYDGQAKEKGKIEINTGSNPCDQAVNAEKFKKSLDPWGGALLPAVAGSTNFAIKCETTITTSSKPFENCAVTLADGDDYMPTSKDETTLTGPRN